MEDAGPWLHKVHRRSGTGCVPPRRDPRARDGGPRRPPGQPRHGLHAWPSATTWGCTGCSPPAWRRSRNRWPLLRAVQGHRDRRREVDLPDQPARQQRGALLQARRRARPRDAAHRLHAHGRGGDPGVQPPVPPPARCVPQHRGRRRHRPGPRRHRPRPRRHRPGRRLRRGGDPRHRRLGRRRDRHLHRQARRLHRRSRHRPRAGCWPSASTSAPTARSCSTTRATWDCAGPGCVATSTRPSWMRS